jgi:hypothetical protein
LKSHGSRVFYYVNTTVHDRWRATASRAVPHKPLLTAMKKPKLTPQPKGFALVITLMLMIILTVVAVGLLSLSSISIRSSGQGQAMASARANARLALLLAIGDLQKSLGPDRAITANSEIVDRNDRPTLKHKISGVWESWWDFDPTSDKAPDYVEQKTSRFRRWLVSNADPTATTKPEFVATAWPEEKVTLIGGGSMGINTFTNTVAYGGRVPINAGKSGGSYAWHVADESVKARLNLYRDPTQNKDLAEQRALLAGHRPDLSVIDSTKLGFLPTDTNEKEFEGATKVSGKLASVEQYDLHAKRSGSLKEFRHDITPYSMGILTDVRHGGLKQDLSSVFELGTNLPPEFNGNRLYQSTLGVADINNTENSDAYWSKLSSYYNAFKKVASTETAPTIAMSGETEPSIIDPVTNLPTLPPVSKNYTPGPVIAKVEMLYSIVARESVSTWMGEFQKDWAAKFDHTINLVVTPQITLHNPYNTRISFNALEVDVNNVPVAFRFSILRSGTSIPESQSVNPNDFESLNEMIQNEYDTKQKPTRLNKNFIVRIANWNNPVRDDKSTDGDIIMNPGQTMICGPYVRADANFEDDSDNQSDNGIGCDFFDWQNTLSGLGIKAKAGVSVPGCGFEINTITPSLRSCRPLIQQSLWFLALRSGINTPEIDKFCVEFRVQQPKYWVKDPIDGGGNPTIGARQEEVTPQNYIVTTKIKAIAGGEFTDYAKFTLNYTDSLPGEADKKLRKFFNNKEYRIPAEVGKFMPAEEIFVPQGAKLKEQGKVRAVCLFSASARTTNGGVYETGNRSESESSSPGVDTQLDGRLAGKPFLFHNPTVANINLDTVTSKPGAESQELNFQPFIALPDAEDYASNDEGRVRVITANTGIRGIKSGSYLEVPSGPMQTIADFRRSNVLASSLAPGFVQPISNSSLHPLMSPDKVIESNAGISPAPLLDHSFLANHALYDRFYFSTFASRKGSTPSGEFENFMKLLDPTATGPKKPLLNQSFFPYLPAGQTPTEAKAVLFDGGKPNEVAYKMAAQYQTIRGPFNVNSTSVAAWKAVLSSMNKSNVPTFWQKPPDEKTSAGITSAVTTATSKGIPIFGMSLLNAGGSSAGLDTSKVDDAKTNAWNGYRELNPSEIDTLANKIVEQVRSRGPFLSMSEFVNRQVGKLSGLSLSGALEEAIDNSEINKDFLKGYVTNIEEKHFSDPSLYNYKTTSATDGNPAAGAPGWVSQGDLMKILEPSATVRSDTFVIRVCGQAKDASGNISATAYAEAVVQRVPEYVDPVDKPSLNAYDQTVPMRVTSTASVINKAFGRRMNVVSFRWLSGSEI